MCDGTIHKLYMWSIIVIEEIKTTFEITELARCSTILLIEHNEKCAWLFSYLQLLKHIFHQVLGSVVGPEKSSSANASLIKMDAVLMPYSLDYEYILY